MGLLISKELRDFSLIWNECWRLVERRVIKLIAICEESRRKFFGDLCSILKIVYLRLAFSLRS